VSTRRKTWTFLCAAALLVVPSAASAAGIYQRGPFLQALGQTGVTIKVELLTPEPVTVEVTGPDGAVKKAQDTNARRFHAVRIEGLAPATAYRYRILAGEAATASDEGRFTTAPADSRPFKFVTYGDSRSDPAAHAAVVRALEGVPADFLLHTGDMVAMGDEEDDWRVFFEIENKLLRDRCVFATVGNHELAGEKGVGAATFLRYFASSDDGGKERPKLYGTFRWSSTRFFLLNAMDSWTGEDRAWIKEELDRALNEPGIIHRFAVLHHGPHSSGPHGGNRRLHDNGVMTIFKEGKVDLVIAGHDHAYERGTGEGIKYLVSGGAGAPLYPKKRTQPETAIYESAHHFVEIGVDGPKVELKATRASGSVLERCAFTGDGPWDCDEVAGLGPQPGPAATADVVQKSSACACGVPGRASGPAHPIGAAAVAAAAIVAARSRRRGARRPA
jgi:acid phosphatase type 7